MFCIFLIYTFFFISFFLESKDNKELEGEGELDLTGLDDDEIDGYIMPASEVKSKNMLWYNLNSKYLQEQKGMYLTVPF